MQYKKDIVEMVAINLGFVADKYYSSRDKMFRTYKTECSEGICKILRGN